MITFVLFKSDLYWLYSKKGSIMENEKKIVTKVKKILYHNSIHHILPISYFTYFMLKIKEYLYPKVHPRLCFKENEGQDYA